MAKQNKFSRSFRSRQVAKKIVIVCEGKTEEIYFESIRKEKRLSTVYINVVNPDCSDPRSIVEIATSLREDARIDKSLSADDEFWVVFDGDEHIENNAANWNEAIESAKRVGIKLGISNPSFELWFLLHYQDQTAQLNRKDALTRLKAYIPLYEKTTEFYPEPLKRLTLDAHRRSEELEAKLVRDDLPDFTNPHTKVYILVEVLLSL